MLDQLRDDLTDSQDLTLAVRLVSDVFVRRIRRARTQLARLDEVAAAGDGAYGLTPAELVARIRYLENRTSQFEAEMRRLADHLTVVSEAYDRELGKLADSIDLDTTGADSGPG